MSGSKQRIIKEMVEDSLSGTCAGIAQGDLAPEIMSSTKLSTVSRGRRKEEERVIAFPSHPNCTELSKENGRGIRRINSKFLLEFYLKPQDRPVSPIPQKDLNIPELSSTSCNEQRQQGSHHCLQPEGQEQG